jgi:hypothetical protein
MDSTARDTDNAHDVTLGGEAPYLAFPVTNSLRLATLRRDENLRDHIARKQMKRRMLNWHTVVCV